MSSSEDCCRCGGPNVVWHAPSPLWNAVMRGGSINGDPLFNDMVCLSCFAEIAEGAGVAQGWTLTARDVHVELETVTPSGRVWSDDQQLWVDPPAAEPICGYVRNTWDGPYQMDDICVRKPHGAVFPHGPWEGLPAGTYDEVRVHAEQRKARGRTTT